MVPGEPEQSINEHLCLATARHSGLDAAETELQTWAGHTVVVVTRFDRIRDAGGALRRVHQEDLHQAGSRGAACRRGSSGLPECAKGRLASSGYRRMVC